MNRYYAFTQEKNAHYNTKLPVKRMIHVSSAVDYNKLEIQVKPEMSGWFDILVKIKSVLCFGG